jgi:hypothetical protein
VENSRKLQRNDSSAFSSHPVYVMMGYVFGSYVMIGYGVDTYVALKEPPDERLE